MTERSALLALAAHFTFKASIEQHGEHAVAAWRQAAELARAEAGRHQGAANGPGNVPGGAGDGSVALRDAQVPAEAVRAAARALRQLRCVQAGWAFGVPEGGRTDWLGQVAAAALEAAAPLIVADCLKAAAQETFRDVIASATEEATTARLAEITAVVRASERERIRVAAAAMKTTLVRPALGVSTEGIDVVPWTKLAALLGEQS